MSVCMPLYLCVFVCPTESLSWLSVFLSVCLCVGLTIVTDKLVDKPLRPNDRLFVRPWFCYPLCLKMKQLCFLKLLSKRKCDLFKINNSADLWYCKHIFPFPFFFARKND